MISHPYIVLPMNSKQLALIPFTIFWEVWKEKNRRIDDEVEESINKIRARWFQTLNVLVMDQPLYSMEDLRELIDILTNMYIILYMVLHLLILVFNDILYPFYFKNKNT